MYIRSLISTILSAMEKMVFLMKMMGKKRMIFQTDSCFDQSAPKEALKDVSEKNMWVCPPRACQYLPSRNVKQRRDIGSKVRT